jgi:hypothetical protein
MAPRHGFPQYVKMEEVYAECAGPNLLQYHRKLGIYPMATCSTELLSYTKEAR